MDLEQVTALKRRIKQDAFRAMAPPFSYGVGLTQISGEYKLAVRVPDDDASRWFRRNYAPRIGAPLAEVDVRIVGEPEPVPPASRPLDRRERLAIGTTVRHEQGRPGTLAFFAQRNGLRGLVSCNHVIALSDKACPRDPIHGPNDRQIGELCCFPPLNVGTQIVKADAAFATVDDEHWPENPGSLGEHGGLAAVPPDLTKRTAVFKIGSTTRRTLGIVTAIRLDEFRFDYREFFTSFNGVIEVQSVNEVDTFSDPGDSGSLVVTCDGNKPVGILFGERVSTGLHYLNPIGSVLDVLQVEMIVA